MNAIIYTTNTGSTEHYAKLLAQKTGLPVYSLAEAKKRVFAGAEVIYLGWIMAGSVKGKLLTDEARELLDSAGCEVVEVTWGSDPVEPVETIMQAAGLRG